MQQEVCPGADLFRLFIKNLLKVVSAYLIEFANDNRDVQPMQSRVELPSRQTYTNWMNRPMETF